MRIIKKMAVVLLVMALSCAMGISASAASTKWNGTSTMQAGKSYVISSAVTMDSKFTVPAKTTLTISNGGSLIVSKGISATIKGTLSVEKGGTLKVNGTLNAEDGSTVKVSGKFTYDSTAKIKLNGSYSVSSTGTVTGSGSSEINLSAKSQYNSDIGKINDYLDKKNYSKACQLLENAITAYPDKAASLRKAYSSAVIDWADSYADKKDYVKACSVLNSAKKYLTDTKDIDNRYKFYQGYIPVRLSSLDVVQGKEWKVGSYSDFLGNLFNDARALGSSTVSNGEFMSKFKTDGKYTNLKATLACNGNVNRKSDSDSNIIKIFADDTLIYTSDPIYMDTEPINIDIDITGASYVKITYYRDGWRGCGIIIDSATFYKE